MSRKKKSRSKPLSAPLPLLADQSPPFWVVGLIVLAALLAYSNSFTGPFLFDDDQAINKNDTMRHLLTNPLEVFFPPFDLTVGGRPLLNLSFAINYAISGMDTWSYHVLNFIIHALVALTLLGVVRRTLLQPPLRERFGADALPIAVASTLLWILNPLHTECVTYISQRAESLMALCYLFIIYCFIRYTDPETAHPRRWAILGVVTCAFSPFFKEITLTAPIMVLLYDRTFVAGSFGPALRLRWPFYLGLCLNWLAFAYSIHDIKGGRVVGYDYGVTAWDYALTECPVLLYYLWLMVWPHPLIIDYGAHIVYDLDEVLPQALGVVTLLIATVVALVRWPLIGFVGAWFFLILSPTSSFIPIVVSPLGEHRLYLPVLIFIVPLTMVLRHFLGSRFWYPVVALAMIYGTLVFIRNEDYLTDVDLWRVTIGQEPDNARAHNNYGVTLLSKAALDTFQGHPDDSTKDATEAAEQFQEATTIQPSYPDAYYNWGNAVAELGHYQEAIQHYQTALEQKPILASAQNNWGNALDAMGHQAEAIEHYMLALQIDPNDAQFHYNLGHAFLLMNKLPEALDQFHAALQLNPNLADAHNTLGIALYQMGAKQQAVEEFQAALRINPNLQAARDNLNKIGAPTPTPTPSP